MVVPMALKKKSQMARRAFLRGVGTTGLMLPFLESIPERSAFAQDEDPRFAFFMCAANGVVQKSANEPERFWPTTPGPLTQAQMQAESAERCTGLLAEHASKLLIVSGMKYPKGATGDTHAEGHVQCLTGLAYAGSSVQATSTGPSADWVIAREAGKDPLMTYAGPRMGYVDDRLSFKAAGQLVTAEADPYKVYLQLAGLLQGSDGTVNPKALELARRRKSVNDLVREDLSLLLADSRLSAVDRQRLTLHMDSIRDIEGGMGPVVCNDAHLNLEEIETIGPKGYIEDVARIQMQLVGLAFSCNMTRAATMQWGDGGGDNSRYIIDGETSPPFHFISNRRYSDGGGGEPIEGAVEMHAKIDRIRMQTFKSLLDDWSQLSTPRGTLFDSALALWTTDVAVGPSGSFSNLPVIIAGNLGGKLIQGQFLKLPSFPNTRLLKSIIEACNVDSSDFAAESGLSPLSEILT